MAGDRDISLHGPSPTQANHVLLVIDVTTLRYFVSV